MPEKKLMPVEKPAKSTQDLRKLTALLQNLPDLSTAKQLGGVLNVSDRQVHLWAEKNLIPTALRKGRVVRYNPLAVARALGIEL